MSFQQSLAKIYYLTSSSNQPSATIQPYFQFSTDEKEISKWPFTYVYIRWLLFFQGPNQPLQITLSVRSSGRERERERGRERERERLLIQLIRERTMKICYLVRWGGMWICNLMNISFFFVKKNKNIINNCQQLTYTTIEILSAILKIQMHTY